MQYLLDIIGSSIVAGLISLIIINVTNNFSNVSYNIISSESEQEELISAKEILENDLFKIGYRVPNNKIAVANFDKIKYLADEDNDGIVDTIYYYCGSTSDLTETSNPLDKPLYRKVNFSPAVYVSRVNNLRFVYADSNGVNLSYSDLAYLSVRNKIKSIQVQLEIDSEDAGIDYSNPNYQLISGSDMSDEEMKYYYENVKPKKWVQTLYPQNL